MKRFSCWAASLSNTVEQIRPVNILVQYCRTDTTREWLNTTRTIRTNRETLVYESYRSWNNGDRHIISKTALQRPVRPVRVVQVVTQWFTSRTVGEPYTYLHTNVKQYCRTHTTREWLERNVPRIMYDNPRSKIVNARKRKTQLILIFFVLKA